MTTTPQFHLTQDDRCRASIDRLTRLTTRRLTDRPPRRAPASRPLPRFLSHGLSSTKHYSRPNLLYDFDSRSHKPTDDPLFHKSTDSTPRFPLSTPQADRRHVLQQVDRSRRRHAPILKHDSRLRFHKATVSTPHFRMRKPTDYHNRPSMPQADRRHVTPQVDHSPRLAMDEIRIHKPTRLALHYSRRCFHDEDDLLRRA
ncbi:hypothetical protein BDZ89DRAFT_1050942 [Hymenopellis radicata]|nr:hypothetical protein BDZ89DRAFT_1050942 [Hymenopellis radicata]